MSLSATLPIGAATSELWDAVVIGAGPAGSMTARELARLGRKVLLVDKAAFPRGKVCGCCLSGSALTTLRSVGLGGLPAREGAIPLQRTLLAAGKKSATLSLPGGVSLSRHRFDSALVEYAIAAGSHFLPEMPVTRISDEADCLGLELRNDRSLRIRGKIAIAADGLNGRLLNGATESVPGSRIGAGAIAHKAPDFFRTGTVYMACGSTGYVGLVRLEDHQLDIGAVLDPEAVRTAGGLAEAVQEILAQTGWPAIDGLMELPWRGTPALTRRRVQVAEHRLFAVGDTTGYVEPFTGEGMAWALRSAVSLAGIVDKAIDCWHPRYVGEWNSTHLRLIGRKQYLCRWMSWLLRSPRLTRWLVGILSAAPVLAHPYLRLLNRGATHNS